MGNTLEHTWEILFENCTNTHRSNQNTSDPAQAREIAAGDATSCMCTADCYDGKYKYILIK